MDFPAGGRKVRFPASRLAVCGENLRRSVFGKDTEGGTDGGRGTKIGWLCRRARRVESIFFFFQTTPELSPEMPGESKQLLRIPQKIDTYFDERARVSTNVCARIYWTEELRAVATKHSSTVHKP